MSATVMGAVMTSGPVRLRLCLALVGIADNADDFGFAQLSIATIASKARCDERTAMRVVKSLESEGWLKVYRRVVEGKGSVYIIDIAKLGIVPDQKSRKSQWHVAFERGSKLRMDASVSPVSGDNLSPDSRPVSAASGKSLSLVGLRELSVEPNQSGDKMSPDTDAYPVLPPDSGDNSQGVQVTFCHDSGDISGVAILKNHRTIRTHTTPPTPLAGGAGADDPGEGNDLAFEAEQRGWFEARNRIQAHEGKQPLAWEPWIAEAYRTRPKPKAPRWDAEFGACESARDAARLVMRRAGMCAEWLLPMLEKAIGAEVARSETPLPEVGYLAWCRYRDYAAISGTMRYSWGPGKFFTEGHWLNPGAWPRDSKPMRL